MNQLQSNDLELKSGKLNPYEILIRISSEFLAIEISNSSGNISLVRKISEPIFELSSEKIELLLQSIEEIQLQFNSYKVIIESSEYVFIPDAIFREQNVNDLVQLQFNLTENKECLTNNIQRFGLKSIFLVPTSVIRALNKLFPSLLIEHHITDFISKFHDSFSKSNIQLIIRGNTSMDILVIDSGKLLLANNFTFKTPEDFVYQVLRIYDSLNLNIDSYNIKVYGLDKNSKFIKLLSLYVNNITCEL